MAGKRLEPYAGQPTPHLFEPERLNEMVRDVAPEVLVFQHWPNVPLIDRECGVPVAIDFHGPLLLETLYQDRPDYTVLQSIKLDALSRADYFTCAGERQREYFTGWLMMAGVDVREDILGVIPVSLSPDLPSRDRPQRGEQGDRPLFVYGGVFLPWQDPSLGLSVLIEELDRSAAGHLAFFGGEHPSLSIKRGVFSQVQAKLRESSRATVSHLISHQELLEVYAGADVAFDLMATNPERRLAFTTRTVEYLWCGLPVVYSKYSELADYVQPYEAGWVVDPADPAAIRQVVREILAQPEEVARRGRNAQELVRNRLTWDRTIDPLDAFCRNARLRHGSAAQVRPVPRAPSEAEVRLSHLSRRLRFLKRVLPGPVVRWLRRAAFRAVR
jgi:glycosyltransferase involved in cell wall biosynthesis